MEHARRRRRRRSARLPVRRVHRHIVATTEAHKHRSCLIELHICLQPHVAGAAYRYSVWQCRAHFRVCSCRRAADLPSHHLSRWVFQLFDAVVVVVVVAAAWHQ